MSSSQVVGDTKYLFRRDRTWWVKLAVPRKFRSNLGYDMRRSLHTDDVEVAREIRWEVIEELRSKIDEVKANQTNEVTEAVAIPVDDQDETGNEEQNMQQVNQHIVEIVSDSGEGAQKCGQLLGLVSGKMAADQAEK